MFKINAACCYEIRVIIAIRIIIADAKCFLLLPVTPAAVEVIVKPGAGEIELGWSYK